MERLSNLRGIRRRREVFRPLAPPAATTEAARGGGTAKRRGRRSRGRRPVPARVAGSRESRAGRSRVRRSPEAPAARRFPVPRSACAQDARSPTWTYAGRSGRGVQERSRRQRRSVDGAAKRKRERRRPREEVSKKGVYGREYENGKVLAPAERDQIKLSCRLVGEVAARRTRLALSPTGIALSPTGIAGIRSVI